MTYLHDQRGDGMSDADLLLPGGFNPGSETLMDRLARAEEARGDERAKRLAAEATAEELSKLIALEHERVVEERKARERAEAALIRAERTAKEMAELVQLENERAEQAEANARQALAAYLDDPFRAPEPPPSRRERLIQKLR